MTLRRWYVRGRRCCTTNGISALIPHVPECCGEQNFDGQMLTPHFLCHLFQETQTFEAPRSPGTGQSVPVLEMDFRGFLDFAMAINAPNELASLKYFWCVHCSNWDPYHIDLSRTNTTLALTCLLAAMGRT